MFKVCQYWKKLSSASLEDRASLSNITFMYLFLHYLFDLAVVTVFTEQTQHSTVFLYSRFV